MDGILGTHRSRTAAARLRAHRHALRLRPRPDATCDLADRLMTVPEGPTTPPSRIDSGRQARRVGVLSATHAQPSRQASTATRACTLYRRSRSGYRKRPLCQVTIGARHAGCLHTSSSTEKPRRSETVIVGKSLPWTAENPGIAGLEHSVRPGSPSKR